jgi:hypothetical protein
VQVRLEQGEQTLRPILMHLPTHVFLLCMIDELVHVALQCSIATGRSHIQATPCLDSEVSSFLHRADGAIPDGLHHDGTVAVDPGDDRGPIFVEMPPAGYARLPATMRPSSQGLFPTPLGLALATSSVIEFVGFHSAGALPICLVGQRHVSEPPTPAVARPDVAPQLSGDAPRRTRQAQQEGRENPVRQ